MGHLVGFPVMFGGFKVDGEGEDGLFRYSHQIGALLFGLLAAGVQLPAVRLRDFLPCDKSKSICNKICCTPDISEESECRRCFFVLCDFAFLQLCGAVAAMQQNY